MLMKMSCTDFLDELASNSPAPGGGSVSALAGSLASSLAAMVASLTLGKDKFQEQETAMQDGLKKALALKQKLQESVQEDTEAFNQVMAAFRMPKETQEEKKQRSLAIQTAMQYAATVPMGVAEASLEALKLCLHMVEKGNPTALSDGGVGGLMAAAAVQGALFNVEINLGSIKDEEFKAVMEQKIEEMESEMQRVREKVISTVKEKLQA